MVNDLPRAVEGSVRLACEIPGLCAYLATFYPQEQDSVAARECLQGGRSPDAGGRFSGGRKDLLCRGLTGPGAGAESALDVIDDDFLEIGGNGRAAQRHGLLAIDKNRRRRLLAGAG